MDRFIRYALIGCGGIAHTHASAIGQLENAQLMACCDMQRDKAEAFGEQYGCRVYEDHAQLLRDPEIDAVCICTPCSSHERLIREAADHGKHILCEKPVMLDTQAMEKLIAYCETSGIQFTGVMQHRYDLPAQAVRKAIHAGHFGRLLMGSVRILWYRDETYYTNSPWRSQRNEGGSVMANQSIHYLDLLLSFMGKCTVLNACGRTLGRDISSAENYAAALLQFDNGAVGSLECTTAAYPGMYAEISVFGEEGSAVIRNDHLVSYAHKGALDSTLSSLLCEKTGCASSRSAELDHDGHLRQYRDFTKALLEGHAPSYTARDALATLQLIAQIECAYVRH